MVSIVDLWLPILLSGVFVFIVSSIIHMVLQYHSSDYVGVPKEAEAMDALRPFNIPPGDYMMPHAKGMKEMGTPEFQEKLNKGPVVIMTVMPNGCPSMGGQLLMWFLYSILVSVFAAYIGGNALAPGAHYLSVFRFVGTTAFMGYSFAVLSNSIWFKKKWSSTIKFFFDGLIYGLVTAGTFGWLWPSM